MEEEINKDETQEHNQNSEKSPDKMTVKELRELAKEIPGVTGVHAMKKDELLAIVKTAEKTEENKKDEGSSEKPLEKMTANELREIAKEIPGVTVVHAMKKDELLAVIKEARGIKEGRPGKKKTKKAGKTKLSVKDIKKKILQLREDKKTARETKDRIQINILRRRINRLKKRTKRAAHA